MQILSETIIVDKEQLDNIETLLNSKYGKVLRWSVVEVFSNKIKLNVSYIHISA